MKKQPEFLWNEEAGHAACVLTDSKTNKIYYGFANCADIDRDVISEKVGCHIAMLRATLEGLKAEKERLQAGYQALSQYYYSVNKSKKYDYNGYMERMLRRQLKMYETDIATINETIDINATTLKEYLEDIDNIAKRLRSKKDNT